MPRPQEYVKQIWKEIEEKVISSMKTKLQRFQRRMDNIETIIRDTKGRNQKSKRNKNKELGKGVREKEMGTED